MFFPPENRFTDTESPHGELSPKEDVVRKSRFSKERIVGVLIEHEAGEASGRLCRRLGISEQTLCR